MHHEWPTKEKDMQAVAEIIDRHRFLNDGELGLIEIRLAPDQAIDIRVSEWVKEITEYFRQEYGDEHGLNLLRRVVTTCMVGPATIH